MAPESFTAFWARERDPLHRAMTVAWGDEELAAEAVDEAMARALQRWDRVGGYDNPAAWVLRVARNWATSRFRKWSRRPTRPLESLDRPVWDDLPDVDLQAALYELSERDRVLLVMRFVLDWTVPQIATVLGAPEGTVKSRLHRALGRLERREVLR